MNSKYLHLLLLSLVVLAMAVSAYQPFDRATWYLEVAPVLIAIPVLWYTYARFPLTNLLYILIAIHALILIVGGHYTYAEVPLFDSMKDWFGFERNNYDKVGHFVQGFVPAILAREILIRKSVVNGRAWLNFFVVSICLAFSAFYELIEWWVGASTGESAEAFLGTQGYVWDTQSDMALALLGAMSAIVFLSRWHDSQLAPFKP